MPFCDASQEAMMDHLVGNATWTPSTTLHLGLLKSAPSLDGSGVVDADYTDAARVPVGASDFEAAGSTNAGEMKNSTDIDFPTNAGSSQDVTHVGLFDALTSGNLIAFAALPATFTVNPGATPRYPAGTLTFKR